jgi:hypothetical protein
MSSPVGRENGPARLSSFVALTGAAIASSCGMTGTLGTLARTRHDGRAVLLSSWHVLYGDGTDRDSDVWLIDGGRRSARIGRTLFGKAGAIAFEGVETYVDCAVASCDDLADTDSDDPMHMESGEPAPESRHTPSSPQPARRSPAVRGHDVARPGDRVTKHGAATGVTTGIVVRVDYDDVAWIGGRPHPAVRQLLIRSLDDGHPFSAAGDSGALLVNESGNAVGLLWGATRSGEGVASPIAPVLYAMNIAFSAAFPVGVSAP